MSGNIPKVKKIMGFLWGSPPLLPFTTLSFIINVTRYILKTLALTLLQALRELYLSFTYNIGLNDQIQRADRGST